MAPTITAAYSGFFGNGREPNFGFNDCPDRGSGQIATASFQGRSRQWFSKCARELLISIERKGLPLRRYGDAAAIGIERTLIGISRFHQLKCARIVEQPNQSLTEQFNQATQSSSHRARTNFFAIAG